MAYENGEASIPKNIADEINGDIADAENELRSDIENSFSENNNKNSHGKLQKRGETLHRAEATIRFNREFREY